MFRWFSLKFKDSTALSSAQVCFASDHVHPTRNTHPSFSNLFSKHSDESASRSHVKAQLKQSSKHASFPPMKPNDLILRNPQAQQIPPHEHPSPTSEPQIKVKPDLSICDVSRGVVRWCGDFETGRSGTSQILTPGRINGRGKVCRR